GESVGPCASEYRVNTLASDPSVVLAPEPFEVAVSDEMAVAVTAHLYGAAVALFDLGDRLSMQVRPRLVDQRGNLFDPNGNGSRGAYGAALRPFDPAHVPESCPGLPRCALGDFNLFYVSSRYSPRLGQVVARGADQCRPGAATADDPCATPRTLSLVPGAQVR